MNDVYRIEITEAELDFLRQLFNSDIAVTLKTVETIAGLRVKVMAAAPGTPCQTPPPTERSGAV